MFLVRGVLRGVSAFLCHTLPEILKALQPTSDARPLVVWTDIFMRKTAKGGGSPNLSNCKPLAIS